MFIILASSGLLLQFALQAFINMGVTMNLLPTKGMTLPFISYGGSSMLAISMAMGMLLGLTRHKYGIINKYRWQEIWGR
jgi:cell division protein FtsW